MMNCEKLLEKAKQGNISAQEVKKVAQQIESEETYYDRYTLLHIIGRSGERAYRNLVESHLEYMEDGMVAGMALTILCDMWGESGQYIDQILRFIRGVEWDDEGYVQLRAISCAGEHLRNNDNEELLSELLAMYYRIHDDNAISAALYSALARAMGAGWSDLPPVSKWLDGIPTDLDMKYIEQAKRKLGEGNRITPPNGSEGNRISK